MRVQNSMLTGLAALFVSCVAFSQQTDFSKVTVKVYPVAGNVYMLEGAGGNIGVSVGNDGIVIVDDQFAPLADKIRAALKGIADKPAKFVINTHYHSDHAGGNEMFSSSATIVAHDNVRKRIASGGVGGNGGSVKFEAGPGSAAALPVITFDRSLTLHLNDEDIRSLHYPNGHTDGDSIVFFTKSNVVHMGDDFVRYGFPFVDSLGGGSVRGMIAACEGVIAQVPANVKIIPGHGPVSTIEDLQRYVAMLKGASAAVANGIKAGKSAEQLKKDEVLKQWSQAGGDYIKADSFIDTLYNEQTGKPTQR
jgi:cyclase